MGNLEKYKIKEQLYCPAGNCEIRFDNHSEKWDHMVANHQEHLENVSDRLYLYCISPEYKWEPWEHIVPALLYYQEHYSKKLPNTMKLLEELKKINPEKSPGVKLF